MTSSGTIQKPPRTLFLTNRASPERNVSLSRPHTPSRPHPSRRSTTRCARRGRRAGCGRRGRRGRGGRAPGERKTTGMGTGTGAGSGVWGCIRKRSVRGTGCLSGWSRWRWRRMCIRWICTRCGIWMRGCGGVLAVAMGLGRRWGRRRIACRADSVRLVRPARTTC